jgi:glycosyltransferase Alg8
MEAWHGLRVAQRHQTMSSLGLSRRLPGITGGMSIHPVGVATEPSFIAALEHGAREHARQRRSSPQTVDDRSSWLWRLRRGRRMLYLPDVRTVKVEPPPAKRRSVATRLMLPGFGDASAAGNAAIALGPARIGLFPWWFLIERRVCVWTPLIGLVVALLFALGNSMLFLYAYLLWVGATRLIHALLLLTARPTISGLYPPLIYCAQIYGALIEAYRLWRVGRQNWPRRRGTSPLLPWRAHLQALRPAPLHVLALGVLIVAAAFGI